MLKELFPEELNVQNNNMNNSMPSQPIPQPIPQETPVQNNSFNINNNVSTPTPVDMSIPEVQVSQPNSFEMNTPKNENRFKMNNNIDNNFNADNSFNRENSFNANNSFNGMDASMTFTDNNNNFNNMNSYNNYGVFDYMKHAASDIVWKRLVKVLILTGLLSMVIPFISGLFTSLLGSKSVAAATISSILSIGNTILTAGLTACVLSNYLEVKRHKNEKGLFGAFNKTLPMWVVTLLIGLMIIGLLIIPIVLLVMFATTQKGIFLALFGFSCFIGLIIGIWISLRYSLSKFLVVDGKSSIEAMRTSRKLMAGHKFQLFGMKLLFFLIYGVAYSIAMGFYALGRLPMIITNEASVIGLIPHILFIGLMMYIVMLPLNIFYNMSLAEFYEDRINNGLNELRATKPVKPILVTLISSLVCVALAAVMCALPVSKQSLPIDYGLFKITQHGFEFNTNNALNLPSNNIISEDPINVDPGIDTEVDPVEPVEPGIDNGGEDIDLNELGNGLTKINYSVPSGYTQSYVSNNYISYADADWNDITLTYEEGYFDLSFYEDMYPGGEHKTIAGHDAYTFVYSDDDSDSDYKEYTCYIKGTKEDDGYCIRVEKEDAFNYVINSINF